MLKKVDSQAEKEMIKNMIEMQRTKLSELQTKL